MPHTRAKTIEALEAKSVADEKKIRDLEAHKIRASNLRKADEKKIREKHDQRFRAYKKWAFAIQKANFKRKREDKARIAKLLLDVSERERVCVRASCAQARTYLKQSVPTCTCKARLCGVRSNRRVLEVRTNERQSSDFHNKNV